MSDIIRSTLYEQLVVLVNQDVVWVWINSCISRNFIITTNLSYLNNLNVMSFILRFPFPITNHFTNWYFNELGFSLIVLISYNKSLLSWVIVNMFKKFNTIKLYFCLLLSILSRSLEYKFVILRYILQLR